MSRYDDIIDIPRWNPKTHPRMSEYDRAAQFAPFAALTGYDEMVSETARLTDAKDDLDEERILALNEALTEVLDRIGEHPRVRIVWFRKDARKAGGAYVTTEGVVRDVEIPNRVVILRDGGRIPMDEINSLTFVDKPH